MAIGVLWWASRQHMSQPLSRKLMQLTAEERFALHMLFRGPDVTSAAVRSQLDKLEVVERKSAGVGFFTTIRLPIPLADAAQRQWDWNFEHNHLSHGGSFMCRLEDADVLELEAVAHSGNWPDRFDPDDFKRQDERMAAFTWPATWRGYRFQGGLALVG